MASHLTIAKEGRTQHFRLLQRIPESLRAERLQTGNILNSIFYLV